MDDTEVSWECPLTHYTEIASLEFRKTAVKTGHEMTQNSGRLILKGLSNILTLPGALLNRKDPPVSEATGAGRARGLQHQSDSGISLFSHCLECVEELSALASEESVGGEACDRGHGAGKFIG